MAQLTRNDIRNVANMLPALDATEDEQKLAIDALPAKMAEYENEPVIKYTRMTDQDRAVDNHRVHIYWCQLCGVLIADRFAHNQNVHKSSRIEVENPIGELGTMKGSKRSAALRESGKKIKIIGTGKK